VKELTCLGSCSRQRWLECNMQVSWSSTAALDGTSASDRSSSQELSSAHQSSPQISLPAVHYSMPKYKYSLIIKKILPIGDWGHLLTLTLTSDDLESHIVVNVSSTLTNTTIWFVAALCFIVYVRTYLLGHLRRWPKNCDSDKAIISRFLVIQV